MRDEMQFTPGSEARAGDVGAGLRQGEDTERVLSARLRQALPRLKQIAQHAALRGPIIVAGVGNDVAGIHQVDLTWPLLYATYARSLQDVLPPLPASAGSAILSLVRATFGPPSADLAAALEYEERRDHEQ